MTTIKMPVAFQVDIRTESTDFAGVEVVTYVNGNAVSEGDKVNTVVVRGESRDNVVNAVEAIALEQGWKNHKVTAYSYAGNFYGITASQSGNFGQQVTLQIALNKLAAQSIITGNGDELDDAHNADIANMLTFSAVNHVTAERLEIVQNEDGTYTVTLDAPEKFFLSTGKGVALLFAPVNGEWEFAAIKESASSEITALLPKEEKEEKSKKA